MRLLLLPLLSVLTLNAHDLYLMAKPFRPAPGATILLSAHTGDSFPDSEQAVDPARLTSLPAADWRILGRATHTTVTAQPGSQFFAVSTQPRYLEMQPVPFRAYLAEEGLTQALARFDAKPVKSREKYAKFAKTYVVAGAPTEAYRRPLGLKIEIVPLADPASVTPGGHLPVQVLYEGKPLADAQLLIASPATRIAGRTNAQGKLDVPITAAGPTRLHVIHMLAVQQPTHDWESYWASLTFEVAPRAVSQSNPAASPAPLAKPSR
jgi:hypothetical protein